MTAPDEFAVLVALCEDANKAWLAIECASDVGRGHSGVAPGGGDSDTHEVSREVSGAVVEAGDSGYGTTWCFMEARVAGCGLRS